MKIAKMTTTCLRKHDHKPLPIGSMYGIYANIWGILMVNVTIYSIHGSYGLGCLGYPILSRILQGPVPLPTG